MEKNELMKTYSANFRNQMSAKGYTQADVAGLLGVSNGSVSVWSRGMSFPSIETAVDIATLFDTTVSEMLGEVDSETYENSTRYHFSPETFDRTPVIDTKEVESMEYLHEKGIVKDDEYMSYLTKKIKEIME